MRDATEMTLTAEVLRAVAGASDPRLRAVSEALVRHLHAFLRDVRPSPREWEAGISFLTRVGQTCTDTRQEFILLSDILGASMLVDAIAHERPEGATASTVFGPFFVEGRPSLPLGADMSPGKPGTPLLVQGRVLNLDGLPVAGAAVDAWHSDEEGFYDVQQEEGLSMRGRFTTDAQGRFWFRTVRPKFYPIPDDGPVGEMLRAQGRHPYRPEHIHFMIRAPGCQSLVTHLFIDSDPYLDSDVVFGVKSSLVTGYRQADSLVAPDGTPMPTGCLLLDYDFVLTPEGA